MQFPGWNSPNGSMTEQLSLDSVLKAIFFRGLAEVHNRNPGTPLASLIESYITIQFNNMLAFARPEGNSDSYTTAWHGPPPSVFYPPGNVVALDILNPMFSFLPANNLTLTSTSSSSGSPPASVGLTPSHPQPTSGGTSHSNMKHIAGGIAGGVGSLAIFAVAVLAIWRHRSAQKNNQASGRGGEQVVPRRLRVEGIIEPFTITNFLEQRPTEGHPGQTSKSAKKNELCNPPCLTRTSNAPRSIRVEPPEIMAVIPSSPHAYPIRALSQNPLQGNHPEAPTVADRHEDVHIAEVLPALVSQLDASFLRREEMQRQFEPPPRYDDIR